MMTDQIMTDQYECSDAAERRFPDDESNPFTSFARLEFDEKSGRATKAEATARPWYLKQLGRNLYVESDAGFICDMQLGGEDKGRCRVDAELIVTAVNSHETLVNVSRKNTIKLHGAAKTHNKWLRFDECEHPDCAAARAVLESLKGE